ncbi:hypothetical protein NBG4_840001 [Candidatus Sulfobium mesophilum]|uniref:IPTL-CTERM protein sorting domain-containing protein n=1 Tax=Candidatus Sulfobium mesophilum TaxID=2016548 RepID=A0A2U3QKW0_9BACT|nr:hypothetical protein NBG4_840001 [Candidatus Sulfobium mesophilum]
MGTLTNTATVTAPAGVTDPVPVNNSATDTDTLTFLADVTTTVAPPATASAGSKVDVPVSFTNNGPSTASAVIYSAQLPGGLSGVTCSGASCSYNNVTGVITITGLPGTLASGQTVNMTLFYTAPSSGTVDVSTSISTSTPESNSVNNSASGSTTINQKAVMVPTLNEWGLILFALLLGLVSVYKMRRRRYA